MAASSAADNHKRPAYAANPVAVVAVCEQNLEAILAGITERVDTSIVHHVDLRGLIKDPLAALGHKEDGAFAQTQEVVFGQDTFMEVMNEMIGKVFFQPELSVVVVNCKHAMHRADVATRILQDVLNSIENAEGQRMFNAGRFQCGRNHCYGKKDFTKKLCSVCDWIQDPWCFYEGDAKVELKHRYGFDATRRSRSAAFNFDGIWDFVAQIQHKEDPSTTTAAAIAFGAKYDDAAPATRSRSRSRHEKRRKHRRHRDKRRPATPPSSISSSPAHSDRHAAPPDMQGHVLASSSTLKGNAPREPKLPISKKVKKPVSPPGSKAQAMVIARGALPPPPPPPKAPCQPAGPPPASARADREAAAASSSTPSWHTFHQDDPAIWIDMLAEMGVDKVATEALFLLAQHSDKGWQLANEKLSALHKGWNNGEVHNSSRYLHKIVMRARYKHLNIDDK